MLDTTSLQKAISALKKALRIYEEMASKDDPDLIDTIKSGVIQNFEVAYEQSWKFIQRWLKDNQTPEEVTNPRTRKDLFRLAAKTGLIEDPIPWFTYGDARNLTSHTYSGEKADIVLEAARGFVNDAEYLLQQLSNRND